MKQKPMGGALWRFLRGIEQSLISGVRRVLRVIGFGRVQRLIYYDRVTKKDLAIDRSPRWLIISVGGRGCYFDPLTGELDGIGSLLCRD